MPNGHVTDIDLLNNKIQDIQREVEGPGPGTVANVLANAKLDYGQRKHVEPFKIGNVEFIAHGDRAWLLEDKFRSGYECQRCAGKQRVICPDCGGSGVSTVNTNIKCKTCKGALLITCPDCQGKGGLLITPDIAQRRPTTGTIMSIGPGAHQNGVWVPTTYKVGQHVVYSNFAGYAIDIDGQVVRVLHEVEIFGEIKGHLTLVTPREMPDSHDSFNNSMLDRGKS